MMMLRHRLKEASFWKGFAISFLIYFILYGIISLALRDKGESFYTLDSYMKIVTFAVFMSLFFMTLTKRQPASGKEDSRPAYGNLAEYFVTITLVMLVCSLFFLGIGLLLFSSSEGAGLSAQLVKLAVGSLVFGGLFTAFAWYSQRRKKTAS